MPLGAPRRRREAAGRLATIMLHAGIDLRLIRTPTATSVLVRQQKVRRVVSRYLAVLHLFDRSAITQIKRFEA